MIQSAAPQDARPWLKSYPDGIEWDVEITTVPVHEQLRTSCAKMGNATALDFMGAQTSFAELWRQVEALAGALQSEMGIKKGDRIALMMPNCPYYVVSYYAVLLTGATVVNCNPLYASAELAHIVGNSGADVMITTDLKLTFANAEKLVGQGHVKKLIVARFPDALPGLKKFLFSLFKRGDLAHPKRSEVAHTVSDFSQLIARSHKPEPVDIDPHTDVAVQQYTGGTTGTPKGAMLSHANIAANMDQIDKWGCGLFYPPSKVVAILPFFHIFAMTVCMNVPLCSGAQVVMLPRFDMKNFITLMKRTKPNVLPSVPTLLHALATKPDATREILAPLEVAISGGAALDSATRDAFAKKSDAILAEGYGLTEASPVVTCAALRTPSKPGSIGLPLPGTDLQFRDLEDPKKVLPFGERGEVCVSGPQVMLGYYGNEEATSDVMTDDGFLRTADVGYVDEDGYVFLVDRIKDLIIASGFNVYPRAIEDAIYTHEAIDEASVIGVKDEYRGEAPVAYVKLKQGARLDEKTLTAHLKDRLSKLEMPREIIFKDELPKTMIGKLSKNDLRADYEKRAKKGD